MNCYELRNEIILECMHVSKAETYFMDQYDQFSSVNLFTDRPSEFRDRARTLKLHKLKVS